MTKKKEAQKPQKTQEEFLRQMGIEIIPFNCTQKELDALIAEGKAKGQEQILVIHEEK